MSINLKLNDVGIILYNNLKIKKPIKYNYFLVFTQFGYGKLIDLGK